jgi:hypothetical protein
MRPLSAYEASGAGFRLILREPRAIAAWILLWFAAFSAAAWTVAAGKPVSSIAVRAPATLGEAAARFGTFGVVLVVLFTLVWLVTVAAVYRAVLRPNERRWFYLRLGDDELRLGILSLVTVLVGAPLGYASAWIVFMISTPFLRVLPRAVSDIVGFGLLATVWMWLGVRLSLIAVETFSERRFHLTAYWPLTRGRFWYLVVCYFLMFLIVLGLSVVSFLAGDTILISGLRLRGYGSLLLAGVFAALTAASFCVGWILFCAAQAHAFRAIVGSGRAGVAPA